MDAGPRIKALGHDPTYWGEWDQSTGNPGISLFANAIQVWCIAQDRDVTVQEAALTFNVTPELIREAVEWHYWMFLSGDLIEQEGE